MVTTYYTVITDYNVMTYYAQSSSLFYPIKLLVDQEDE